MRQFTQTKIVSVLSIFISMVGLVVMIGWLADIQTLKSILPHWATMKFSTASCFFLSGCILYFSAALSRGYNVWAQILVPVCSMTILLFMATLLTSVFLTGFAGVEGLFVQERNDAVMTTVPGRPSIGTMISFIALALYGLFMLRVQQNIKGLSLVLGYLVAFIGASAVIGYSLDFPKMYFLFDDISSAMAFHTAVLFSLAGFGIILLHQKKQQLNES